MGEEARRVTSALRWFSTAAGVTAALVGTLVLTGRALNGSALTSVLPGLASMKANTALSFLLAAFSLWLAQERQENSNTRLRLRLSQVAAAAVTVLSLLTLSEYVFGWELGIDQLFFKDTLSAAGNSFPGRAAPNTVVAFLLLGSSLWVLDSKWKPARRIAMLLALGGGLIPYVGLLGYAYSEATLYHLGSFSGMALHTAGTLFLTSLSIVCARPERQPSQVLSREPAGRRMALLLLAALLVPATLGWLRLFGQRVGWFELEMGTALLVASTTLIFLGLIYWTAHSLNRQEVEFRLLFVSNPQPMWVFDQQTLEFLEVNQAAIERYGYSRQEFLRLKITDIRPEEDVPRLLEWPHSSGIRSAGEWRHRLKDGAVIDVEIVSQGIKFKGREAKLVLARDVTERKRLEAERARAQEAASQLVAIVESSEDAIIGKTLEGVVTSWNRGAQRVYGYFSDEMVGRNISLLVPPENPNELPGILDRLRKGESIEHFETIRTRKDGTRIHVSLTISALRDASGKVTGASTIARDITERKRLEERLNLALRSSGVGTWNWNLADKSVVWDEHMGPLFGFPPQPREPTYDVAMGSIHPEDRERVAEAHAAAQKGGDEYRSEYRVVWPDGTIRYLASRGRVFRDAAGVAVRMAGASWDITERKRAELEIQELNAELEKRVEARTAELVAINQELEAFTYSVSHDLRAPLRHISGFSRMLADEYGSGLDSTAQRYLERIQHGTRQMGLLVDDLLNLARIGRQDLRRQATALNSLVDEVLADLKPEANGRQVEWKVGRLPFVECDPALMKQVLYNLASNALKYTRPRKKAVIEISSIVQAGAAVIVFRDNGVGFSMKYADKLFGVFQRLHRSEDFEGTGIGLATVQRILHKHGGRVWTEAELDKGATFYFTLEPADQKSEHEEIPTGAAVTHDGASS